MNNRHVKDTPRIQEMHILAGHIICEIVEEEMTGIQKSRNEKRLF